MSYKEYKLENLVCWQKARFFRKEAFEVVKTFPSEAYKLKFQFFDALGSIGHNIAEGFGRGSFKENIQFCRIARGSALEVRDQLYEALDCGYIKQEIFNYLYRLNADLEQSINGHIGFLKQQMIKYK